MFKSLIILVLLFVLAAGAFLTRPSEANFETFVRNTNAASSNNKLSLAGVVSGFASDAYLRSVTFHDRLLWTSIEQNGQTQYVGLFSHWFATSAAPKRS